MFSIYSSAFNVIKNSFDYESAVENFCNFAEEVVIAVNKSEDDSFEAFKSLEKKFNNLKIVSADFDYSDPLLDGKIKNAALQKTSNIYKIGLDLDERIPTRHKDRWIRAAKMMYEYPMIYGFLIPSIDIWKSLEYIQADPNKNKNFKWYLHKENLHRGAVNFAKLENGKIDREKSDTCELLDQFGNLVNTPKIYANFENDEDYFKWLEEEAIFVFHLGFLDFEKRIIRNKNFWNKHWETVSGKKHETAMTLEQFDQRSTKLKKHNLKLWDKA